MLDYRELMTTKELAELYRVNPRTVHRWIKDGKIKGTRTLGGHHRFYKDEVEAAIAAQIRTAP